MNQPRLRRVKSGIAVRAALVLTAAILALAATSIFAIRFIPHGDSGPKFHIHGEGPLSDGGAADGSWAVGLDSSRWQGRHTFATLLCLTTGSQPATIIEVRPHATVGSDFRFLGAVVRDFTVSTTDHPMNAADGYPPDVPDPITPAIGFRVEEKCADAQQPNSRYIELMVGIEGTGPAGGGWTGEEIEYTSGGGRYVLVLELGWLICGTALADREECGKPPVSSPPFSVQAGWLR